MLNSEFVHFKRTAFNQCMPNFIEFPTVINWDSPFLFQGMLGGIFPFYSSFNRKLCKQTVET